MARKWDLHTFSQLQPTAEDVLITSAPIHAEKPTPCTILHSEQTIRKALLCLKDEFGGGMFEVGFLLNEMSAYVDAINPSFSICRPPSLSPSSLKPSRPLLHLHFLPAKTHHNVLKS